MTTETDNRHTTGKPNSHNSISTTKKVCLITVREHNTSSSWSDTEVYVSWQKLSRATSRLWLLDSLEALPVNQPTELLR